MVGEGIYVPGRDGSQSFVWRAVKKSVGLLLKPAIWCLLEDCCHSLGYVIKRALRGPFFLDNVIELY